MDVSILEALDGLTSTMNVQDGHGPATKVTFHYDIDAGATVPEPSTFAMILGAALPGLGMVIRKKRARGAAAQS